MIYLSLMILRIFFHLFLLLSCPPRTFLPALCRIFLDECAPDNVLEVTARAITYYLDVSAECTRRIVAVEGAIKALCNRLVVAEMSSRTSRDLAEQCIKVSMDGSNLTLQSLKCDQFFYLLSTIIIVAILILESLLKHLANLLI